MKRHSLLSRFAFIAAASSCMFALPPHLSAAASLLDSLGIRLRGSSRPFCYTNKAGAFYYGQSNSANTPGWEGFAVEGHNYLEDYALEIDGTALDRRKSVATIFPDFLRREYPGGIVEELRPADSIAAIVITIDSPHPVEVKLIPFLQGGRTEADFETIAGESSLTVARRNHNRRTAAENYPVWLSLFAPGCTPSVLTAARGAAFSPGSLVGTRRKTQTIAIATGDTREESLKLARYAAGAGITLARSRRARMESLLSSTAALTSDNRFDRALAWAKLSLDALTVTGGGIFAGLPWFADYWGRDTFISLPGEALVTGNFADAERILGLFALFQQRDSLSTDYGRIPNRVTATDTAYNTADGTPRSVLRIVYEGGTLRVMRNGAAWPAHINGTLFPARLSDGLRPAHPHLREGLKALRGPGYPLLPHDLIVRKNPAAVPIVDAHHPSNPDLTHPAYTYPRNPAFVPGSFALRRFTVSLDSSYAYSTLAFGALSDPGWHPEYGFQLTFAAIAIDEDGIPGSGERRIGRNASLLLDSSHCFEKIIFVGGGIQIEDARGKVLAAYIPVEGDALKPFGDAATGTIRFALPLSLLGYPAEGWTYTVIVGGQDDHGGSGLGEFRTVNREQGEWNGGGKLLPGDPNIYDTLVAQPIKVNR